jgi:hypothetical protein
VEFPPHVGSTRWGQRQGTSEEQLAPSAARIAQGAAWVLAFRRKVAKMSVGRPDETYTIEIAAGAPLPTAVEISRRIPFELREIAGDVTRAGYDPGTRTYSINFDVPDGTALAFTLNDVPGAPKLPFLANGRPR